MPFLKTLLDEIISFFGIGPIIDLLKTGDYSSLRTLDGILSLSGPLIPLLLLIELSRALVYKKFNVKDYKLSFFILVFNRVMSRFISIAAVAFCIGLFEKHAPFKTSFTWYWLIYGYIVWEFAHFIYHFLAHKVRLLWVLHSTHHVPQTMNLSVTYAHFFLEAPYADVIRTSICILAGVSPPLLFLIMFIDGTWGAFIHVGENLIRDGRLGFLSRIILTPSHHRVHHARNPLYMDTNFCNLLNVWDKFFGTFQSEQESIPVEYGITRKVNPNNFLDSYFGEIPNLWKDVKNAPGIRNKFLYLMMPPGWSHDGQHKTAKRIRDEWLKRGPGIRSPESRVGNPPL
jgi:sterol desaturase/sphingolipid hydroxylase (fatty acid hydroxylase superfamily)